MEKQYTEIELKAYAYDLVTQMNSLQAQLQQVNSELVKLQQQKNKAPVVQKEKEEEIKNEES